MTTHHFQPTRYYNAIGQYEPVLRVKDGDTIITTTIDAGGSDQHNQQVANRGNPMTGPFYVEGAEPGDTLVVHLDRLFPNREIGYVNNCLAPLVVDPEYVHKLPRSEEWRCDWRIDGEAETASVIKPGSKLDNFTLPLKPMLGCFGVAPERDQSISTATSGPHGGNMDYRGFVEGVTAYFPVSVPGALFYLGDGHAIQGDGEIAGTGIEISFDVQFTLSIIKGKRIYWPRGENADYIFTAGNARPLDQALQHATTEMSRWLEEDYGLDGTDIGVLMGQCVEYDLGNMFDPSYTMICKMSKQLLSRITSA
jgi:acetamidase/formamidase